MVFSRIAAIFSSAQSSTIPYTSIGLSPQPDSSACGFGLLNSAHKNNLRLSSSLQDFSAYRRFDPEEGDPNLGISATVTNAKQHHSLQREDAGSSFSKEKATPGGTPFMLKKWVRVIMVFLCLVLFSFLVYMITAHIYSNWSQKASKYYVVLDCGSTGTRVYVYQASMNHKKDGSLPFVLISLMEGRQRKPNSLSGRAYDRVETEPGFDKLVNNVSGLRAAIKPLIRWAKKQIPNNAHRSTSLYLYATAGVRRLPNSDSKWILDNAWSILKNSPFECRREWIKIISGMEEAYFGWIALNYQTGMLGTTPKKATFGALDLGGSSLQVTFENEELVHNKTSLKLRIGAVNHHLNAYSLPGYGLNDAFDKSVVHLFKRLPKMTNDDLVDGKIELQHPCLQTGYKERYVCAQCTSNYREGESPLNWGRLSGKGGKAGIVVKLVGAPNWEECNALARVAVNLSEWSNLSPGMDCDLQPCALPDSLPHPSGQFYALSGFFVVYRFFNLTPEAILDDVLEKGREFCGKTWKVAKTSVAPQPFIEQYCFRAPYIVCLLREGLHIIDNQIIIGSGSITWTLGVALSEAGKAFSTRMGLRSYEMLQMNIEPIIIIALLFISLIFLICMLSCVGNWMPRFFRRPYLPLFRYNGASATSVLNIPSPFRFQHWSPISLGDGKVKMPLSPTVAGGQQRPFGLGHGLSGSSIQLMESSLYPSSSGVSHSYSSNNLGQMQFDSSSMGSFWSPHRSQMHLQSRRSQSREDLSSSLAEAHIVKV